MSILSCVLATFVFSGGVSHALCPFFYPIILLLSFMSSLYILDANPLLHVSFVNIFFSRCFVVVVVVVVFWLVSFAVQLFGLMKSHWFVFAFVSFVPGDIQKILLI